MSYDEQPDGDPYGECAAEIHRLEAELAAAQAERDDQWATAIAKYTPADICKMIADEMSARGDK